MRLNRHLPFEKIIYVTDLGFAEAKARLDAVTETRSISGQFKFWRNDHNKPYEGSIDGDTFEIVRVISYRNSFLPKIKGRFFNGSHGTVIEVKMRLHTFVTIFLFIWIIGVLSAGVITVYAIINNDIPKPLILAPFGMLLFLYLLTTLAFKSESKKSKKFLAEVFDASIVEE